MSTGDALPSTFVPRHVPPGRRTAVLLLTCLDTRGIVAAVAEFLARHGANIVEVDQHTDHHDGMFFQRVEFELDGFALQPSEVLEAFREVSDRFAMQCELRLPEQVARIAVLASKQPHCLLDLLARWRTGELHADLAFVASNHDDHAEACAFFGVPFHHLPVQPDGKGAQEARLAQLVDDAGVDLIVLARYMQVLSEDLVARYPHRVINIHHSLLPAFVGAKPYHQAYERGVKVIGATAHYATAELDQGPIIAQDVARVTHRDSVEDLVARGRDLEALVLARAVRLHLAAKVLVYGNRTVVFG
ncbi:MAG: Formyltetrahydrofolate deformylase [Frankiales bacterium]|jgi:formyltetrahydrofolate deformylase|nr:Formyltetrahydrofolate deformylase [Frankiales bacterium]